MVVDGPMGLEVTSVYGRFADAYDADARALLRTGNVDAHLEARNLSAPPS